jgi:hypothetical protein
MAYAIFRECFYTGDVTPAPKPGLLHDGDLKVVAVETTEEALQLLAAVTAEPEELNVELGEYAPPTYKVVQVLAVTRPVSEAIAALV